MQNKRVLSLILSVLMIFTLSACSSESENINKNYKESSEVTDLVKVNMENDQAFVIKLRADKAPYTVENFQNLVKSGFYDGLTFHRIIEDFVMQGGDPNGDGTGGPGYAIYGEFLANGFEDNDLKHEKGAVAMARAQDYNSAGSQFYICLSPQEHLDGQYAVFGKVVAGMETVESIANDYLKGKIDHNPVMESVVFVEESN